MVSTFRRVWINLINLSGEYGPAPILKRFFSSSRFRLRLKIWYISRDGFGRPPASARSFSTLGLNLVFTCGIPPAFRDGIHSFIYIFNRPRVKSRVYLVTQLRIDGIHCRESAGTEPVNLKVVPNECGLGRSPWTIFFVLLSFSHTHHYWYVVDTCDTESFRGCCPQENFDVKKENKIIQGVKKER